MARSEGKMEKLKEAMEKVLNLEDKHSEKKSVCTMCGKPATQVIDGESSCSDHIEQVCASVKGLRRQTLGRQRVAEVLVPSGTASGNAREPVC
jgi:hypothetical protein